MTVEGYGRNRGYDQVSCVTPKKCDQPGLSSNIKVVVRVRPENRAEQQGNYGFAVQVLDERMLVFDPNQGEVPEFYQGKQRRQRDIMKRKHRDIRFVFDRVLDEGASQLEVYEATTKGILDGVLDGYNCSVFAYGATGAGKTFTMKGSRDSPGVMFHTMMELYRRIEALKVEKTCDVAISYLEVYNEQIRDLLMPGPYLPIREDPNRGTIVSGLSLHKPRDATELLHMLEFGNENRTQHPTDANAESSRSHAVFQVFIRQRERTANTQTDVRVAKMSLIDLAGSERATVTTNRGQRFREGANINRSLLALGNCINALAEGKGKGHIPYRNSKLTRLLKDSLGGNCRTVMIAAVSPSYMTIDDTHNTLKYANRAKNIKANLKRNVLSVDFHITKYTRIVEELRAEVTELKDKLAAAESGNLSMPSTPGAQLANFPHQLEVERLQHTLYGVFYERLSVRQEIGELEGLERDLLYRIIRKHGALARLRVLNPQTQNTSELERQITGMEGRRDKVHSRKKELSRRMDQNVASLEKVEGEIKALGKDNPVPELLEVSVRTHHLEVELRDTKRHVKHLKKLCRRQERHATATERLLHTLLAAFHQQQHILQGSGIFTSDLSATYTRVQALIEGGGREVAWADQSIHEGPCDVTVFEPSVVGGGNGEAGNGGLAEDFDALLEFPVLSLVKTTPKTPRGASSHCVRRRHSTGSPSKTLPPSNINCSPVTPCTPEPSALRGGELLTPLHSAHRQQHTPARMRGSYQLMQSGSQQLMTPLRASQASVATQPAENRLSIDGDSEVFNNITMTIAPSQSILTNGIDVPVVSDSVCRTIAHDTSVTKDSRPHRPNIDSRSYADIVGKTAELTKNNVHTNQCHDSIAVSSDNVVAGSTYALNSAKDVCDVTNQSGGNMLALDKNWNDTFNVIDGVAPLEPSPSPVAPTRAPVIRLIDQLELAQNSQKNMPAKPDLDGSFTGTQIGKAGFKSTADIAPKPRGILKGTVTKSRDSAITCGKENGSSNSTSVARGIDFQELPRASPAVRLTFADVVKSPASLPSKHSAARSPLASRENLPPFPQEMFKSNPRRTTFAANELDSLAPKTAAEARRQTVCASGKGTEATQGSRISRPDRVLSHSSSSQNALRKFGLPSVQEAAHNVHGSTNSTGKTGSAIPNYMRLTTAFRNRGNGTTDESQARAKRVPIDLATVTKKPARVPQRSKSAVSVRRGMYF